MRHRMGIAAYTGLGGNSSPVLLDNKGKLTKEQKRMMRDAMKLYKPLKYGVDFQLHDEGIAFGREPAYQYNPLLIISMNIAKELCFIQTGKAFDVWGRGIRSRQKLYQSYQYNSKFKRFIDKWHAVIFPIAKYEKVEHNKTRTV